MIEATNNANVLRWFFQRTVALNTFDEEELLISSVLNVWRTAHRLWRTVPKWSWSSRSVTRYLDANSVKEQKQDLDHHSWQITELSGRYEIENKMAVINHLQRHLDCLSSTDLCQKAIFLFWGEISFIHFQKSDCSQGMMTWQVQATTHETHVLRELPESYFMRGLRSV